MKAKVLCGFLSLCVLVPLLCAESFSYLRFVDSNYPNDNGTAAGDSAYGDLNKDGKLDIVAVGTQAGKPATLLYLYTTYGHRPIYDHGIPGLDRGACVAIGDVDGDGIPDVVAFGKKGAKAETAMFRVFINNGIALFREGQDLGALLPSEDLEDGKAGWSGTDVLVKGLYNSNGLSAGVLELKDLDRDGDLDLLFSGTKGEESGLDSKGKTQTKEWETSGVFLNDGKGQFSLLTREGRSQDICGAGFPKASRSASCIADFDGDGILDLVMMGQANLGEQMNPSLFESQREGLPIGEVYLGLGDGSFKKRKDSGIPALLDGAITCADFNRDGKKDLAIIGTTGKGTDPDGGRFVGVFLGKGDGSFSKDAGQRYGKKFADGLQPVFNGDIVSGDIDLDGDVDLIIAGDGGKKTLRFYENRSGLFVFQDLSLPKKGSEVTKKTGITSSDEVTECDLGLFDMDGDGDRDLIINGRGPSIQLIVFQSKTK